MSKLVYSHNRYTMITEVKDVIKWMNPHRMSEIRAKLVNYPETEIYNDDEYLADSIVILWRNCADSDGNPAEVDIKSKFKQRLVEILGEMGLFKIIKTTTFYNTAHTDNEIYDMKDGTKYFPTEDDYLRYLLKTPVRGSISMIFGKIHSLFETVEDFQDAIVEGQSNWNFMMFSNDKEARERLDKKAMVKYVRDDGTIRFEAYKNAYDYAKRKKEER